MCHVVLRIAPQSNSLPPPVRSRDSAVTMAVPMFRLEVFDHHAGKRGSRELTLPDLMAVRVPLFVRALANFFEIVEDSRKKRQGDYLTSSRLSAECQPPRVSVVGTPTIASAVHESRASLELIGSGLASMSAHDVLSITREKKSDPEFTYASHRPEDLNTSSHSAATNASRKQLYSSMSPFETSGSFRHMWRSSDEPNSKRETVSSPAVSLEGSP